MQPNDILARMGGIDAIARDLDVTPAQAERGAQALLPAILGGFKSQAQAPAAALGSLGGLGDLLSRVGGGGLLDQVLSPERTDPSAGNEVLGQIFGSRDVSRTVADDAAQRSGLDPSLLRKMLPVLAMLVTGYMARQGGQAGEAGGDGAGGGLGGLLGGLLGGGATAGGAGPASGGLGGLGSLIDMNGDGNALDDILRLAGKAMR